MKGIHNTICVQKGAALDANWMALQGAVQDADLQPPAAKCTGTSLSNQLYLGESKQTCWYKLYNASYSEANKYLYGMFCSHTQFLVVNHPISCADRTRQWSCTQHLWTVKHSVHDLSAFISPGLSAVACMSSMYSSGRPQDSVTW